MNCKSVIDRGVWIAFDTGVGKFVHTECARAMAVPVVKAAPVRGAACTMLPAGVRPRTLISYCTEWARYEAMATRRDYVKVPGKDGP